MSDNSHGDTGKPAAAAKVAPDASKACRTFGAMPMGRIITGLAVLMIVLAGVAVPLVLSAKREESQKQERLAAQRKLAEDAKFVQIRSVTASVTSGQVPLPVTFTAEVFVMPDASPVQYRWYFGDGRSPFLGGASAAYRYVAPGRYEVRLSVIDAKGREAVSEPVVIVATAGLQAVPPAPPSGSAAAKPVERVESPFAGMARELDRALDKWLPPEDGGSSDEMSEAQKRLPRPEGAILVRLRPGVVVWSSNKFGPGATSPWFEMVGPVRLFADTNKLGRQTIESFPGNPHVVRIVEISRKGVPMIKVSGETQR